MSSANDTPKAAPVEKNNGYPNAIANTQTTRVRGCGAATKGTGFNNSSPKPPFNIVNKLGT
jgi:hypothetical protein